MSLIYHSGYFRNIPKPSIWVSYLN